MAKRLGLMDIKYKLTPALEVLVGKGPMSRPQIMKHIWEYIKKHQLQSMPNKRMIVPDTALAQVTGESSFSMMGLTGKLGAHIKERTN